MWRSSGTHAVPLAYCQCGAESDGLVIHAKVVNTELAGSIFLQLHGYRSQLSGQVHGLEHGN